MYAKAASVLATLALFSSVSAQSSTTTPDLSTSTACPSQGGAHIIVARGSLETPPYGVLVVVKDAILAQVPGSTADGTVGYPNTLQDYFVSESDGVLVARSLITDFVSRCPGAPLVLFGYSQGANIMGDALLGQKDNAFPDNSSINTQLSDQVLSQVAALVLLGDPTFIVAENSFNAGNATKNGSFPRQNAALFNTTGLAARTRAYCDADDLFCAGGSSLAVHVSYVQKYASDMTAYAVNQIKAYYAAGKGGSGSSATGGMTTSAVGVATGTVSGQASKTSACKSIGSGGIRTSRVSSGSVPTATATPSTSATVTGGVVSTGAASVVHANMASAAGAGAILAGLFAAFF